MEDVKFILAYDDVVDSVLENEFNRVFEIKKREIENKIRIDFDLIDEKRNFLKKTLNELKNDSIKELENLKNSNIHHSDKYSYLYNFYAYKEKIHNTWNGINFRNIILLLKRFVREHFNNVNLPFYLSPKYKPSYSTSTPYETYFYNTDTWTLDYHIKMKKKLKKKYLEEVNCAISLFKNHYKTKLTIFDNKEITKFENYKIEIIDTDFDIVPLKALPYEDVVTEFRKYNINFDCLVKIALYVFYLQYYNNHLSSDDLLELETGEKPNPKLSRQIIILNELGIIENLKNKHIDIRPISREIAKLLDDTTEDSINSYITGILNNYTSSHNPYKSPKNKELVKELKELFKKYSL